MARINCIAYILHRYNPVIGYGQPTLKEHHETCKVTKEIIRSFGSVCYSIPDRTRSLEALVLHSIPTRCECIVP